MTDLIVAGGGPAGLGTAILAAQAGLETVVVEPRRGPIDKCCGEGLMPHAVHALARMGVRPCDSRAFRGIRYVQGASSVEAQFPARETGLGIRRTVLHEALTLRAAELGVRWVEGRVTGVRQGGGTVEAAGLRARWLVAADGLHSPIRRGLGLEVRAPGPQRYGIRRHFRGVPWTDLVEVHWADGLEAYVTPVSEDLVGVAVLFRGRARWDSLIGRFPALREKLGVPVTRAAGAGPFCAWARRRVHGRILFVGDAAGFCDPITGEGIRLGLASAAAAVRAIRAGRPGEYERAWNGIMRPYWFFTTGLLRFSQSSVGRGRLVPALERLPWIFRTSVQFLGAA